MVEIGHNLGLDHSGEGSNEYADQSGKLIDFCSTKQSLREKKLTTVFLQG